MKLFHRFLTFSILDSERDSRNQNHVCVTGTIISRYDYHPHLHPFIILAFRVKSVSEDCIRIHKYARAST